MSELLSLSSEMLTLCSVQVIVVDFGLHKHGRELYLLLAVTTLMMPSVRLQAISDITLQT